MIPAPMTTTSAWSRMDPCGTRAKPALLGGLRRGGVRCGGGLRGGLLRHLDELERHPIALADREVLLAVLFPESKGRRQRPDSLGVVLRVLRVGVELALARELEAGRLDGVDDPFLGHVPLLRTLG